MERLDGLIEKHTQETIALRRDIHQHPELGMEEERTSKLVKKELEKLGLEVQDRVGKMGVVGILRGEKQGKTLLLRADMDALPIEEQTDLPFASKQAGKMHACGHDVHTAILLGAAKVLSELKGEIQGNIKFVFQPAEESNPTGGARYMIEDGVLENPPVDGAMALHIKNIPLGQVALRPGIVSAKSDRVYLRVKGKSAHASEPHRGVDAILAAGQIMSALQSIVSRNINPMDSAVVTIGTIHGGSRYNVICDEVVMEGTVRTFNPEVSKLMPSRIESLAKKVAEALECSCEVQYVGGYSNTINDVKMTEQVIELFRGILGQENVLIPEQPSSGGEDFSEFAKRVPSVYYWLGMESELNTGRTLLHNPHLLVDERAIPLGMKTLSVAALDFLK
ncbi:MAG: amidohydrolase [Tissierellia bacterium]|nr:amidohydrolase [Tissierellia bacterium]